MCSALDPNTAVPSLVILDQFIDMHRVVDVDTPVAGEDIKFEDFSPPDNCPFCDTQLEWDWYEDDDGYLPFYFVHVEASKEKAAKLN